MASSLKNTHTLDSGFPKEPPLQPLRSWKVEVEVQIDQQYIDQIVPGREVTLRVQGTGSRDGKSRDWPGKVASIVPRTNWQEGSRSFPVIIRMQNEFDHINDSADSGASRRHDGRSCVSGSAG